LIEEREEEDLDTLNYSPGIICTSNLLVVKGVETDIYFTVGFNG
jgi:hypothetical protein